jgi:hypothetical protein
MDLIDPGFTHYLFLFGAFLALSAVVVGGVALYTNGMVLKRVPAAAFLEDVTARLAAKREELKAVELSEEERRREAREVLVELERIRAARQADEERLSAIRADIEASKDEARRAEEISIELTEKLQRLAEVERDLRAKEERVEELKHREANVADAEARLGEIEAAITALAEAEAKAQEKFDRTNDDLQAKRTELQAVELGVTEAVANAEAARRELDATRSAAEELERRISELQRQAQIRGEEIEALDARSRDAEVRAEAAERAAAAAAEAEGAQQVLLADAEKAAAEAASMLERKQDEVLQAERTVTLLQVRASALEAEILRLRGEHSSGTGNVAGGKAAPLDLERVPECLGAEDEDGRIKPAMDTRLPRADERDALERVRKHLNTLKLSFPERTLKAFHTSLKVSPISPLTVLAGISGTGKSQLPRRYAEAMGLHFLKIAVQPRWDGPQDILGFYNYLEKTYKATDLARAMVHLDPVNWPDRARQFQGHMMLVLLDEMNLARVEYYFSEFLSGLEGRPLPGTETVDLVRKLSLQLDLGRIGKGVRSLYAGHNILFVGSMNEDESTLSLSDKVLDRSNLLRFPRPEKLANEPPSDQVSVFHKHLPEEQWRSWCRRFEDLPDPVKTNAKDWVRRLNEAMDGMGRPFGHRLNQAILSYVANYPGSDDQGVARIAFADQIEQRILPKLRGVELADSVAPLEKLHGLVANELKDEELAKALRDAMADDGTGRTFNWRGVRRSA